MSATQHLYETTFIINASLEDPQIEGVNGRVQEVITKNKGEIKALDKWGRKRLAYPIKKKNNGYYVHIECEAPPSIVKQLEHFYGLEEQILRHLTIRVDKRVLQVREQSAALRSTEAVPSIDEEINGIEKLPLLGAEETGPSV